MVRNSYYKRSQYSKLAASHNKWDMVRKISLNAKIHDCTLIPVTAVNMMYDSRTRCPNMILITLFLWQE